MIEGVETYMPVDSEPIEKNVYKIVFNKYMDLESDLTSIYEFYPGDIVSCEIVDDILLAKKRVSSTFINWKYYHIIFRILETGGELPTNEFVEFENELLQLKNSRHIPQRDHPFISRWLELNV